MSSKPFAELDYCNANHSLVVSFYNLHQSQMNLLRDLMMFNDHTPAHEARSGAMAHLGTFCTITGRADIFLHTSDRLQAMVFVDILRDELRIHIPTSPSETPTIGGKS